MPSWSLERESGNYKGSNLRAKLGKSQKTCMTKGHKLPQGIFSIQGSNPGLQQRRWILYQLGHKGSPRILEWVAYPFSSRSSWPRNSTGVSCIGRRILSYQESPPPDSAPNRYTPGNNWTESNVWVSRSMRQEKWDGLVGSQGTPWNQVGSIAESLLIGARLDCLGSAEEEVSETGRTWIMGRRVWQRSNTIIPPYTISEDLRSHLDMWAPKGKCTLI